MRLVSSLVLGLALTACSGSSKSGTNTLTNGGRNVAPTIDTVTLTYPGLDALAAELEATGSSLLIDKWNEVSENAGALASSWANRDGGDRFPLTFEVLYGMAFGPPEGQPRRTEDGEIATFSVDSLLKSRNLGYDGNGQ